MMNVKEKMNVRTKTAINNNIATHLLQAEAHC
jgi:hypothetical protein